MFTDNIKGEYSSFICPSGNKLVINCGSAKLMLLNVTTRLK